MWQVLLAAAVAGSTSLVAKHLFSPNADAPADPSPERTGNPFDNLDRQVSLTSALGSPPVPSGCNDCDNGREGNCKKHDGIFRFSSSGAASPSGSRNCRKKVAGVKKIGEKSGCVEAEAEAEVPRKSARRFAVSLKRRKIGKNVAAKSGSSSSKDNSLFGWGLGVGIMYMMSAGKVEISKLNIAMDETAKVVQELKTELSKKRSLDHLQMGSASELDAKSKKNSGDYTQLASNKFSIGSRDHNCIKDSVRPVIDDGECASSVLTEEPEPMMHEIDQLEAELESELQKLPCCITEAPHPEEMGPAMGEPEASATGFHEVEDQSLDSYQFRGVVPAELDQKLCHLLIEQQEHQIGELESELQVAQSKLLSKEAELLALKDCVRRLTAFSLSNVSDDETEAHEEQGQTSAWDCNNKTEFESNKLLVGMKRTMDFEPCGNYLR